MQTNLCQSAFSCESAILTPINRLFSFFFTCNVLKPTNLISLNINTYAYLEYCCVIFFHRTLQNGIQCVYRVYVHHLVENLSLSKIRLKYKKWSISSCIFYSLCFFCTLRIQVGYTSVMPRDITGWLMHGSDWAESITRKINKRIEKFGYNLLWCIVVLFKNSNESFITTSHNWMHIYIIHCYKTVKVFEN